MSLLLHLFRLADACGAKSIFPGGPSLYDGVSCSGSNINISSVSDILKIVGNVIRILVALSGGIAVIVIIVAAIFYITSAGDPSRVKRAKDMIVNTAVGLILIMVAYTIITFIAGDF